MNIVSTVVGLAIMGAAAPMIADMSIQPIMAQKRAENFSIAEATAVTFAAKNEGATSLTPTPSLCNEPASLSNGAYSITCTEGAGTQFVQTVTRSFRLKQCDDNDGNNGHGNSGGYDCSNPGNGGYADNVRVFNFPTPTKFTGHQCPTHDTWGVNGYNDAQAAIFGEDYGACIPDVAWSKHTYKASNPDSWLYDINNHNGWGEHSDY
jgi:hypothetical protein|tara:strand:+ start:670 stop:1290 length:621 start_codon:yes stop_codon:yes gene_type:complete